MLMFMVASTIWPMFMPFSGSPTEAGEPLKSVSVGLIVVASGAGAGLAAGGLAAGAGFGVATPNSSAMRRWTSAKRSIG